MMNKNLCVVALLSLFASGGCQSSGTSAAAQQPEPVIGESQRVAPMDPSSGSSMSARNDAHGGDHAATSPDQGATSTANAPAERRGEMSDGEILGLLAAVDAGEIAQGNLARTQATDARVREFGQRMVTMHTESTTRMNALRTRLNIAPQESDRSRTLASEASATQQRLSALHGAEFDRAYMNAQTTQHAAVLDLIDHPVMASVQNAELRGALSGDVRPMVESHRAQSAELEASLATPATTRPATRPSTTRTTPTR